MQACWSAHTEHHVVTNAHQQFDDKLALAAETVLMIARDTHPQAWHEAKKA